MLTPPRQDRIDKSGTSYTFVTGGIKEAVRQARGGGRQGRAAGGRGQRTE
jgi:hypothetical protein